MRPSRKVILAAWFAAALLATGISLRAQESTSTPSTPPSVDGGVTRHSSNLNQLAETLGLTQDQQAQFIAAIQTDRQKMKALREDGSLSRADRRVQAKQAREELDAKLKNILTPDQFVQWQQMLAQRRLKSHPTAPADTSTNAPPAAN